MPGNCEESVNPTLEKTEQLYADFKVILSFGLVDPRTQFEIVKAYIEKVYINTLDSNFRELHEKLKGLIDLNLDEPNGTLDSILQAPERISFIRHQLIGTLTCNTPAFIQASRIHKQLCTLEESSEYFVPKES